MSLFKTRVFWNTEACSDESFDQNSLLTTKLDSDSEYIITGSHAGVLRIFKPSTEVIENVFSSYKPTDLIIEKILDSPILQIGAGKLISGSQSTQLVVLHPRTVSVYTLTKKEGVAEHGTQHILQLIYEHKLNKISANIVVGPFGGSQNRDFICVQSLDGILTFFEQESTSFYCSLQDFLLPGPIAFVKKSDIFVIGSSNWQIESYRYKLLYEFGMHDKEKNDKKLTSEWTYNLGEPIVDINVLHDHLILILGERNLFCLTDSGRLKFLKHLDYSPICFTSYIISERVISLVVSETSTLLIYQDTSLKWSAQLQLLPVSLKRSFLTNIMGAIVLLSEEGQLQISYLGTEPSLFVAPPVNNQALDFEKVETELVSLNDIIKNTYSNDIKIANTSTEKELLMNININPELETCLHESNIKNAVNNQMCRISIIIQPQATFEEVQISICVQNPLKVIPQTEFYSNLNEKHQINCCVFLDEASEIPSLNLQVVASFISNLGVPRTLTKFEMLPLNLVLESCQPQKDSEYKVTLNINQGLLPLSTLFAEFIEIDSESPNAVGFKNVADGGKAVNILVAKSTERYRVQSDSFASLNLLIEQLIYRLKRHFGDVLDFSISYSSPLPIEEVVEYIKLHFAARQKLNNLQNELIQLSAQFRLVQKRLISKFKMKNPTPLGNLQILLEDTYSEIMSATIKIELEQENLGIVSNGLSCSLNLLVNLIKLTDANKNGLDMIDSTLCSNINDIAGQSWEDVLDASLSYLLRTTFAVTDKDKLRAAHTSFDEVKDISKVERHLVQVLERLLNKPLETHFNIEEEPSETITPKTPETEKELVPIGSKIAVSSSRLLSARKRTPIYIESTGEITHV